MKVIVTCKNEILGEDGKVWATGKQDVTGDFLNCVVEKFGPKAGMTESVHSLRDSEGVEMFEIVVRKVDGGQA